MFLSYLILIVDPIVGFCVCPMFCWTLFCVFLWFCNSIEGKEGVKERAGYFTLLSFLVYCDCYVALPQDDMGWSYDRGIS